MSIKEFIDNFAGEFDDTPKDQFEANTVFKELEEWSSLVALSIIAMVEENYDKMITGEDIRNSNTIEDLFNIVNSNDK